MFYIDQHKLAAYLERTGAEWEEGFNCNLFFVKPQRTLRECLNEGRKIRPVLRYGLPSHLQSEIHNPDNLTEEQICEGGKYRACVKGDLISEDTYSYWRLTQIWREIGTALYGNKCCQVGQTPRLPATVPWPDWERKEVAQPAYKETSVEAEIAACELLISSHEETIKQLRAQLATSPWRRMSEVPTEEDADADGCVSVIDDEGAIRVWRIEWWRTSRSLNHICAWMPVPKFHGWPNPLADLLKAHGVAVTPGILADLNAWKGVEK